MFSSGHHDRSTKAAFLCTAVKLQCWPMLARYDPYWRMLAFLSPHFIHWDNSFRLVKKLVSSVYLPFPLSVGRLWYANLQKSPFVDNQDAVNSRCRNMLTHVGILYSTISTFHSGNVNPWQGNSRAPALGGACAMGTNTMALIQTSKHVQFRPS